MGAQLAALADGIWLATGTLLGVGAVLLWRKWHDWRETRLMSDWDPY